VGEWGVILRGLKLNIRGQPKKSPIHSCRLADCRCTQREALSISCVGFEKEKAGKQGEMI